MDTTLVTPEAIIARLFDQSLDDIDDDSSPESISGWDSQGHIVLVMELEGAYGVSFSPEEVLSLTNVRKVKTALSERGVTW
jgi:acyl carrier protein